jgi:ribosomal protein S18 acetylase RimI-like enzyme
VKIKMLHVNRGTLAEYSTIPSYVEVHSILNIRVLKGAGGITFCEKKYKQPYLKNYDEYGEPFSWLNFDVSNWVMFVIRDGERPVGGITLVSKTPEIRMLNYRDDLVDIWDIRVHPDFKRQGFGTKLFKKAMEWSRYEGYKQICVETQNINVPACRFYLKQGCRLGAINIYAYYANPKLEREVQLIWFLDL